MKNANIVIANFNSRKNDVAKKRWNILAEALFYRKIKKSALDDIIENNFNFFKLFNVYLIPEKCNESVMWCKYCIKIHGKIVSVKIRQSLKGFTIEELKGFNNTGNIRIWPSEEVLAYFVLNNNQFFNDKQILEVGGGLSCLTGMMLAQIARCHSICVTDGNYSTIQNVREILIENSSTMCPVSCDILVWSNYREHLSTYDIILAADCLFFDEYRTDLIQLLFSLLKYNGTVLIVAPKRGDTLGKFINESHKIGFKCFVYYFYDKIIWSQRTKLLKESKNYNEDLHYPFLIILKKRLDGPKNVSEENKTQLAVNLCLRNI